MAQRPTEEGVSTTGDGQVTPPACRQLISGDGYTIFMCPPACFHDFSGWRNFEDGSGGEMACSKCGMGAMAFTLQTAI